MTAENRLRRRQALGFVRELRAVAHIVDMHQLTKDPDRLLNPVTDTESSPRRSLTRDELGRYVDYCSDEVEALTVGLSGKIWQKIMRLEGPG